MKIKIQKNSLKAAMKPKPPISPAMQQRMRYAAGDTGGGGIPWPGVIVVAGVVMLGIGLAVGAKASHDNSAETAAAPVVTNSTPSSGFQSKRYDELGGKTMSEWMRQNNTNNALLKSRQAGVKARSVGVTQ